MSKTKCFIINYNRLTLMMNMADHLTNLGLEVYIIDNNSTYEPLLDYYKETTYKVLRMDNNYGHTVFWTQKIYDSLSLDERYILTDSDLDISQIPKDFLKILNEGLDKYPQFDKCGFSLEINDLPDTVIGNKAKEWERQFWVNKLDENYYNASVDTTFALYKVNKYTLSALRTNRPYCVKHIPWYYDNFDDLPVDEQNYFNTIATSTHWSKQTQKH